eukprot:m.190663 g.190663  ORF g.190663 m.190663 type:complete len:62 (+) comp39435_c0_seq13:2557-2742(+)
MYNVAGLKGRDPTGDLACLNKKWNVAPSDQDMLFILQYQSFVAPALKSSPEDKTDKGRGAS